MLPLYGNTANNVYTQNPNIEIQKYYVISLASSLWYSTIIIYIIISLFGTDKYKAYKGGR